MVRAIGVWKRVHFMSSLKWREVSLGRGEKLISRESLGSLRKNPKSKLREVREVRHSTDCQIFSKNEKSSTGDQNSMELRER